MQQVSKVSFRLQAILPLILKTSDHETCLYPLRVMLVQLKLVLYVCRGTGRLKPATPSHPAHHGLGRLGIFAQFGDLFHHGPHLFEFFKEAGHFRN